MIALITPTGARPVQLLLCMEYMSRQTYQGEVVWVIVDDALPHSAEIIPQDFRAGWTIIVTHPLPYWREGQNTQGRNLKAGFDALRQQFKIEDFEALFIIEDDDFYRARYLEEMMLRADGALVWGETYTIYYNVPLRRWIENQNDKWSSLFQTAFKPAALPRFEALYGEKFIDYVFFQTAAGVKLFRTSAKLSIGIKGLAGRHGIGAGHGFIAHMIADPAGVQLYEFIGNCVKFYLHDWDSSNLQHEGTVSAGL